MSERRGDAAYPDSWAGTEREATTCRSSNSRVQPQGEPRARWRQPATVGGTRTDIFSPLHPSAWGEGVQGRKNVLEKKNGDLTPPRLHSRPSSPAGGAEGAVTLEKPICPAGQVQRLVRRLSFALARDDRRTCGAPCTATATLAAMAARTIPTSTGSGMAAP